MAHCKAALSLPFAWPLVAVHSLSATLAVSEQELQVEDVSGLKSLIRLLQ